MTRQTRARGPLARRDTPNGEIRIWRRPRQAEAWPTATTPIRTAARSLSGSNISPAVIRAPITVRALHAGRATR